jgi:RNA polymerase sigma factor (sigma-70 family)
MPEQHPDQRFIEGLAKNDYQIIKEIDQKFRRIVIAWIRDNNGSTEDAEDIYTESILAIFDRLSQSKPLILSRPFSAYLMGIARNKWYEVLRKRKKEAVVRNDQVKQYMDELDESVEEELIQIEKASERQSQLDRTFAQLSKLCQELLNMIFYRGLNTEEIVKALEFSTDNAYYVRKKKCLDRWRVLLAELN